MATLKSRIGAWLIPLLPLDRRAFDILRFELRAWRTRAGNALNPAYHRKIARLRRRRDLSLNLGSGGRGLPNWINVELVPMRDTTLRLDIRRALPLADACVARIFAEHVVEHVDFRANLPPMLRDWYRILQPGGTVRIVVPDARRFVEAYVAGDLEKWKALGWDPMNLPHDIFTTMHVVNHTFHQEGEHLFGYDFETLKLALVKAGFPTVEQCSFGNSRDPLLAIDQPNHKPYSLYVEAVKL